MWNLFVWVCNAIALAILIRSWHRSYYWSERLFFGGCAIVFMIHAVADDDALFSAFWGVMSTLWIVWIIQLLVKETA